MTTVDIPQHLAVRLRNYEHIEVDNYAPGGPMDLLGRLAKLLPPAPYVPEVGDLVRVFNVKTGDEVTRPYYPEVVVAVTDELVITLYRPEARDTTPPACAYRIDAHGFEKVEQ